MTTEWERDAIEFEETNRAAKPPTPPGNATQEEVEGQDSGDDSGDDCPEPTMTCAFCGETQSLDSAIDEGWVPSYWSEGSEMDGPVCPCCTETRLTHNPKTHTYNLSPEFVQTTLYTSAPAAYDGFSTRTEATVGRDTRNGEPVRKVSIERRDYSWQTGRYNSGLCRFTTERTPLEMFVKFGDWVLD